MNAVGSMILLATGPLCCFGSDRTLNAPWPGSTTLCFFPPDLIAVTLIVTCTVLYLILLIAPGSVAWSSTGPLQCCRSFKGLTMYGKQMPSTSVAMGAKLLQSSSLSSNLLGPSRFRLVFSRLAFAGSGCFS